MRKTVLMLILLFTTATAGCKETMYPASKYFDGRYLQAAEMIDSGNEVQFKAMLPTLNVDTRGREQMTLLWYAIVHKKYDAIRDLVAAGSQPDDQGIQGFGSALHAAVTSNDVRILRAMLDGGLSPDFLQSGGGNLLQRSMFSDAASDLVRLLVERGANINLRDSLGCTALDDAIYTSHPEIAIYLVQHGADVTLHALSGVSTAWAVQRTIEQYDPPAKPGASITAYSIDADGKLVSSVETPPPPGLSPEGQKRLMQFKQLRTLMIERGAKFPADPPARVRAQMELHQ